MHIDLLREFVVYAQYMNLTKAAQKLHMSQPNLSRHLKQLEAEIGFPLFLRTGQKYEFTPAGEHFLVRIDDLIRSYDRILQECLTVHEQQSITINAMQHYYSDEGSLRYYELLYALREAYPNITLHYSNPYRENSLSRLRNREVDIVVTYLSERPQFRALLFRHLADIPLGLSVSKESPLALKEQLEAADLKGIRLFKPNDANIPFYVAFEKLCAIYRISPLFHTVGTCTQTEFYSSRAGDDCCFVMPYEMRNDQRIKIQTDRVVVPLSLYLKEYMVWRDEPFGDIDSSALLTLGTQDDRDDKVDE